MKNRSFERIPWHPCFLLPGLVSLHVKRVLRCDNPHHPFQLLCSVHRTQAVSPLLPPTIFTVGLGTGMEDGRRAEKGGGERESPPRDSEFWGEMKFRDNQKSKATAVEKLS